MIMHGSKYLKELNKYDQKLMGTYQWDDFMDNMFAKDINREGKRRQYLNELNEREMETSIRYAKRLFNAKNEK